MAAYYDEKQKSWYTKFRYTDWQGNSKSTSKRGFKTKKEALAYESDMKNKLKEKPQITLKALSDEFLTDYKANNKYNSYVNAEKNCRKYIIPTLGSLVIDKITPLVVRKWQADILQYELSDSTLRAINTTLCTMLNYAVKYYGLQSNPMKITGKQGKYTRRLDFLEVDEWEKINNLIDDLYDKVTLNLMYWTGIRIAELMGLTKKDIDLKANTISINKQYSRQHIVSTPKTESSNRVISIPSFISDLLRSFYKATEYVKEEYIFSVYHSCRINDHLKKYCRKAEVKEVSPHALRHSHASWLIRQGVPINAISKRLGHASPAMTLNIYSHCYKTQGNDIAQLIDKTITKSKRKTKNKNVGQM